MGIGIQGSILSLWTCFHVQQKMYNPPSRYLLRSQVGDVESSLLSQSSSADDNTGHTHGKIPSFAFGEEVVNDNPMASSNEMPPSVDSNVTITSGSITKRAVIPPFYLLNQPFYIYEDLLWLNSTTNGETIEQMLLRGYTWKHNDDIWFVNAALKHPMRTTNPEEAVLFVVPSFINMFLSRQTHRQPCVRDLEACGMDVLLHIDQKLGQSPWFQRNQGKDHVLVATIFTASMRLVPGVADNLLKCNMISMESRKWNAPDRLSVPSYYVGTPCLSRPKEYDFAMIASVKPHFTFESRRNICEWLANDRPQYTVAACGEGHQCPGLAQARFGFHVRGDTYGANRLMDTILSGTIPIFTMKEQYDILPDWIRWDDFSYFADVTDKSAFLATLDDIVNNQPLYEQKMANLMANRDLYDWQTPFPFDTYMYMFLSQIYPQYQRSEMEAAPFGALLLSKPGGFDAFDVEKKHVWCGDSGPAPTCGECQPLFGRREKGCRRMCHWCEFGYDGDVDDVDEDDYLKASNTTSGTCIPQHLKCRAPDLQTFIERTARPYRKLPADFEWCFNEDPADHRVRGLLFAKTYKTGSTTAAAVTYQIATRVGQRKGFKRCLADAGHSLSVSNRISMREPQASLAWTTVRDPATRALSTFAYYALGKGGIEPSHDRLVRSLSGAKNNQIAQLRSQRGRSAEGNGSAKREDVPESEKAAMDVIKKEIIPAYDFIAVTERMDESLVVMKMLWNLEYGDIITASAKQAGGWSFNWNPSKTCFYVPKFNSTLFPSVQKYIDTDFRSENYDYMLHEFANRSLDATIEQLGRKEVEKGVAYYRRLKERTLEHCQAEIIFPCSEDGKWQAGSLGSCYQHDIGCGYRCINHFLDKLERGNLQPDLISSI